ncbi:MAG: sigma-70 family RNA polymerase sigma factor [Phycisphaeraceae bacterium]|nr:sigma-70 family RNA polymerase sigma factor [Phycisphaeraceae bacterium]
MNERSDAALVAAAIAGDPEQFAPIVQRYQDAVFAVALARLGNFHDAQDVVQNVFLEAFQRISNLNDPARLGAWLRSITIHRSIDHLRRSGQTSGVIDASQKIEAIADGRTRERTGDLRDQVMAAIGKLSRTQRETTTLFYINGYSQQEVAAIQEVPVGTVKRRLHDARAKLKQEMLTMVEDVLKSEAPKEDAAQRVYELLCRRGPTVRPTYECQTWWRTVDELLQIGAAGIEGYERVLESPNSALRSFAMGMLNMTGASGDDVNIARAALSDPNRKVRSGAVVLLHERGQSEPSERGELAAMLVPMLRDPSRRVRRTAACVLYDWPEYVPLEDAAAALAAERDYPRNALAGLVNAIIASRRGEATND